MYREPAIADFVVLRHEDRDGVHFDLMIDTGAALATWKCSRPPEAARDAPLDCRRIGDHRRIYLDYEGPISGDRGAVRRHDRGKCQIVERSPERWRIEFQGRRLIGHVTLSREVDESWRIDLKT